MNIHVSEDIFNTLKQATLLTIKMGSRMYGLNNEKSDTDLIHIIATPKGWNNSLVWTHHNLQYKEEGVDHVFTTLQNFVRNILKGDSTINYECLYSEELKNSPLSFLYDMRNDFNNYSLLRSYLGLVRRDLKLFSQNYDNKKLFHALRGLWTVNQITTNSYSNDIEKVDNQFYHYLKDIKNLKITDRMTLISVMKETGAKTDTLRTELADKLAKNMINRIMDHSKMKLLDDKLKEYCLSNDYTSKVVEDVLVEEIYKVLNTDVTYSN